MSRKLIITGLIILISFSCTSNKVKEADAGMDGTGVADADADADGDGDADADADGSPDASADGGCKWRKMYEATGDISALYDIWGSDPDNIFAVGFFSPVDPLDDAVYTVILHYNGISWNDMKVAEMMNLDSIWGINDQCIFASGSDLTEMLKYDGEQWKTISSNQMQTRDIWGSSENDIYAVGNDWDYNYDAGTLDRTGSIFHYDGVEWTRIYDGGMIPAGIWGSSSNDVYVVGQRSIKMEDVPGEVILHYDGHEWTEIETEDYRYSVDIWGFSASDVFVVNNNVSSPVDFIDSTVRHYDGNEWAVLKEGIPEAMEKISGSSGDNIYVTGRAVDSDSGAPQDYVTYHYDGYLWNRVELDAPWEILRIWTCSKDEAFAVARNVNSKISLILHYSCE